jgi:hypothetical protein
MEKIAKVDFLNLMLAGPALISLAAGMAVLSGGGLISGLLDGIGSLFGAESPFDKIAKLGDSAKHINKMSEEMRNMGDTVDGFTTALNNIDGSNIGSQFFLIADGLTALNTAVGNINLVSIAKLALLGAVMPGSTVGSVMPSSDNEEPQQVQPTTPTFGPGITPTEVNANAVPQTGMSDKMKQMMEERLQKNQAKYGDAPGGFTQTVNGKTVSNNNMSGQADTGAEEENPALQTNQLLSKLVNLQEQNNRTGKKQQRSIEGLEI